MTILSAELPFTADDVSTLVQEVGAAVLDVSMIALGDPATDKQDGATACVHVTGDWEGSVILETSPALSKQATATMFDMDVDDIGDEEMADALGELANIVGGSVKGLMPGSCRLSLPTVTLGPDSRMVVPGLELVHRVVLDVAGEHLVVALWKRPAGVSQPTA
jgi:chemotaxis protein CheX